MGQSWNVTRGGEQRPRAAYVPVVIAGLQTAVLVALVVRELLR